jgi:hypothetical protein
MRSQPMRSRQLLLNHAPGAILETVDGPVVIRTFDALGAQVTSQSREFPGDFEIHEQRLSSQLPGGAGTPPRLHSIPSNAEINKPESWWIVDSKPFPNWLLCTNSGEHGGHSVLYQRWGDGGSICPHASCEERGNAIRFVSYCSEGHLDDVDWRFNLHDRSPGGACENSHIIWRERDSSMSGVSLSCSNPSCPASKTLADVAKTTFSCSGRSPEKEAEVALRLPNTCTATPKITQRQSTILWQSTTQSVISTPMEDSLKKLISEFFGTNIRTGADLQATIIGVGASIPGDPDDLFAETGMQGSPKPEDDDLLGLLNYIWVVTKPGTEPHRQPYLIALCRHTVKEGIQAFRDIWESLQSGNDRDSTKASYRMEFEALMDHSDLPRQVNDEATGRPIFCMDDYSTTADLGSLQLEARPISLLRTVSALVGYTRGATDISSGSSGQMVPLSHNNHGTEWYAASEAFGEGIIIYLSDGSSGISQGERWAEWLSCHENSVSQSLLEPPQDEIPWPLFRSVAPAVRMDPEWTPTPDSAPEFFAETNPMFVWWHTLAHHLIRAVQAETGYSSASIRERVYAIPDSSGAWRGAIVLHVTEGMDGTLGGLTSLLPNLQLYLDRVEESSLRCSNDPLCEETPKAVMPQKGCYACTLNPETSCEHRNMFLDRLLLIEGADI